MAQVIPENIRPASRGESILFNTLKDYLPDSYIVYHEPFIKNRRPDFVVIGPEIGVVVLEVKDYDKSSILGANKQEWILQINGNIVNRESPLTQARKYAMELMELSNSV